MTFTESDRYSYNDLTKNSLVIDAGSYEGNWANLMNEKYGCQVIALEPVPEFYANIANRFAGREGIIVLNAGLAGTSRKEKFGVKGALTGIACPPDNGEAEVQLIGVAELLNTPWCLGKQIDLLKLNVEGSEFEILDAILDGGIECRFSNLQIQPHDVIPNAKMRWGFIRNRLQMNFRITHEDPALGTGWALFSLK